jgi:uncharacterized protein YbbC (DUF1343 family)
MIETGHGRDEVLGVPIYSLYSEVRKPTPAMLKGLECFVVDLQDVGTRIYTFVWTMMYCLEACSLARIPVVVLDRGARWAAKPSRARCSTCTTRASSGARPFPCGTA